MMSDDPLPLKDLIERVLPETFLWLNETEKAIIEECNDDCDDEYDASALAMFASLGGGDDDDDNDGDGDGDGDDEYNDEGFVRVQEWCSSVTNPDGIGGTSTHDYNSETDCTGTHNKNIENDAESSVVRVKYILSSSAGGHGDDLWAAARHVANLFAHPEKCKALLSPLFDGDGNCDNDYNQSGGDDDKGNNCHPLHGLTVVEFGSGAGVPSWTAMKCGARVVCTDQAIPDRIRCLAESAERNLKDMNVHTDENTYAKHVKVCPHDWGNPVKDLLQCLRDDKAEQSKEQGVEELQEQHQKFDVCIAADCIYMPQFHSVLLQSIQKLMAYPHGVALLPFALHGNTDDDKVWDIVPLAQSMGFGVEVLRSEQLTPQSWGMDLKRGLVHMIRLTHSSNHQS